VNVCDEHRLCPDTVRKLESLIQQGVVSFEPDRWNRGDIRLVSRERPVVEPRRTLPPPPPAPPPCRVEYNGGPLGSFVGPADEFEAWRRQSWFRRVFG